MKKCFEILQKGKIITITIVIAPNKVDNLLYLSEYLVQSIVFTRKNLNDPPKITRKNTIKSLLIYPCYPGTCFLPVYLYLAESIADGFFCILRNNAVLHE